MTASVPAQRQPLPQLLGDHVDEAGRVDADADPPRIVEAPSRQRCCDRVALEVEHGGAGGDEEAACPGAGMSSTSRA